MIPEKEEMLFVVPTRFLNICLTWSSLLSNKHTTHCNDRQSCSSSRRIAQYAIPIITAVPSHPISGSLLLSSVGTIACSTLFTGIRTSSRLTCARRRHARRTFSRWIPARINSARWTNARLGQLPD